MNEPVKEPANEQASTQSRHHYDGPAQRYRLVVAYDGSGFHGWQKQHPPDGEPLRTVQEVLDAALMNLLKQPVITLGASRTDSGVHALGQVVAFDAATPIPVQRLRLAINGRLPADVDVRSVDVVPASFHVLRDVESKQYRYTLWTRDARPLGIRHMVHACGFELDLDRMNDAAARLVGTHDIEGFAAAGHGRETTVRTIHHCRVMRNASDPQRIEIEIAGDGFLLNTVRIVAGTLVEVGRGQFEPSRIDEIFATADRRLAGPTLPARGLCLEWIRYGKEATEPRSHQAT